MGFGKVAPAPLMAVCASAQLANTARHSNTLSVRIT